MTGASPPLLDWIPGRIWLGPCRHSRLMWTSTASTLTSKMRSGAFACPRVRAGFFASGPPPGLRLWRCRAYHLAGNTAPICAKRVWLAFSRGCCPPEILLVHYLDDFLLVFTDREVLREAGRVAVRALIEAGFLISPKSVLDPVPVASFLGKELDLQARQIRSHEQALLQLWAGWLRLAVGAGNDRHLQSFLGLLNWHVRPRGLGCPFAAGAYCWLRWGRTVGGVKQPAQGFPLKMLGSLATLVAVAAEPWQAPGGEAWRQLRALQFETEDRLSRSSLWCGGVVICVDGARDAGCWRVGALVPGVGVRTHVTPPTRFASQQTTELRGVAWAVRFAVRTGHRSVTVCSDSEAAIAQVLRLRATSHLTHHQTVLRSLARVLWVSGIVLRLVWVPSALQPGDPMSRVTSVFGGSQARAEVEAWCTWDALLENLGEARVRGVVCLRRC